MIDKVFSITGNKISSFVIDDESLKFSSSTSDKTVEGFKKTFEKKLSLATKVEIKYGTIKSIKKEDNDGDIFISYKGSIGLSSHCEFSFTDPTDYDTFFAFLEKERYFTKINETLTPFKAIRNYLIGLITTIGITIFAYYQAIKIADGTVEEAHSGKSRLFNYLVGLLGDKGVIGIGIIISGYLIYKIWARLNNPPTQIKFLPPNS